VQVEQLVNKDEDESEFEREEEDEHVEHSLKHVEHVEDESLSQFEEQDDE